MARWEVVIGLETHTQLSTQSKIFSGASTAFGAAPNSQASAVDIALPGVLPVLNKGVGARSASVSRSAARSTRKACSRARITSTGSPKGYQISQYEIPVVQGGSITIASGDGEKVVRLTRAHLEEDAGKSLHDIGKGSVHPVSGIDLNRAGTPLLEIVSEPDMRSAAEAVAYAKTLHALVRWIDICDGNMQEGSFRCDANVSVRRAGTEALGTRCEIKNLNSFRFLQHAIEYEIRRQIEVIEDGGKVVQETRLYDADRDETRPMRGKEDAHDYRYFPDPDLPPLVIDSAWIERVKAALPELPEAMKTRFVAQYELTPYEATALTASRETARFFEDTLHAGGNPKLAATWIMGELSAALNRTETDIAASVVTPDKLALLLARVQDNTISGKIAKEVFDAMWDGGGDADAIIEARGLEQISDVGTIEKIVDDVIAANPAIVTDVKVGKEKAFNSLVGQVMKASKGKANPAQVNAVLKRKLGA
jgi:aspartyl-tRNA(Asn)/glutamyl-tRNA(Gln) amidotransferase subunit B